MLLLHNEKKAVHNIIVYCKEKRVERKIKKKAKQGGKIMRINGLNGTDMQPGTMGMTQANDPISKNIQNQIASAQQKLQDLSSNEEMTLEDKMKKRQEIQREIASLNQQLRKHQIELKKEQQSKNSLSMDDVSASTKNISVNKGTGMSQEGMQAMISADSSMKQAKVQGNVVTQMEGRAGVLESEIKQDAGRGNTEKKEAELEELQAKVQSATAAQISTIADADKSLKEAADADNNIDTDEKKQNETEKSQGNEDVITINSAENSDIKEEKKIAATVESPVLKDQQNVTQKVVYTPINVRL